MHTPMLQLDYCRYMHFLDSLTGGQLLLAHCWLWSEEFALRAALDTERQTLLRNYAMSQLCAGFLNVISSCTDAHVCRM